MADDAGLPRPRTTTHLPPVQRLAAAIIFQTFNAAEKKRSSGCAAMPLPSGSLPAENLDRALENFPQHRHRSSVHFDPAAARKAYQTRLKRGNWMKPRKR